MISWFLKALPLFFATPFIVVGVILEVVGIVILGMGIFIGDSLDRFLTLLDRRFSKKST